MTEKYYLCAFFLKILPLFTCLLVYYMYLYHGTHVDSRGQLVGDSSINHVSLRNLTQVIILGSIYLCLLSHVTSPMCILFNAIFLMAHAC